MLAAIPLNGDLIHAANYNSFNGNRGDLSNGSYLSYAAEILEFPIADSQKEKLLRELHKRYSVILRYEARHVSIMVAGPARYNAKKLDHGEDVLRSSHDFCEWFEGVREQVKSATKPEEDKISRLVECISNDESAGYAPTKHLMELAFADNALFIQYFERLLPKYKWRKNSNIYRLYARSKVGEVQEIRKETVFEDDNFSAYKEGDRYYIKFVLRPKRQLHVALKSRGWWWNSYKEAYSTYLTRYDPEWVKSISERYKIYI